MYWLFNRKCDLCSPYLDFGGESAIKIWKFILWHKSKAVNLQYLHCSHIGTSKYGTQQIIIIKKIYIWFLTNTLNKKCYLYYGASGTTSGKLPEASGMRVLGHALTRTTCRANLQCKLRTSQEHLWNTSRIPNLSTGNLTKRSALKRKRRHPIWGRSSAPKAALLSQTSPSSKLSDSEEGAARKKAPHGSLTKKGPLP